MVATLAAVAPHRSHRTLVVAILVAAVGMGVLGFGLFGYRALRQNLLQELRQETAIRNGKAQGVAAPGEAPAAPSVPKRDGQTTAPIPGKADFTALPAEDQARASGLAAKLAAGDASDSVVIETEILYRKYPHDPVVGELLRATLLTAVDRQMASRSLGRARELLDRARALFPTDALVTRSSLRLLVELADWASAEGLATATLATDPASADARRALALALAAQGKDKEALRAIYQALEVVRDATDGPKLRELRDQIERRLWVTSGCELSQLPDLARDEDLQRRMERFLALVGGCASGSKGDRTAHFSMATRRTGDDATFQRLQSAFGSPEAAGGEILSLAEHQYSSLVIALDHNLSRTVPIVLLTDVEYAMTTGAPSWSGGQFDDDDGTITLPLNVARRQFGTEFTERVLIHEVAHAFIDEITKGTAPRELHEGLAKYLEREVTRERSDLTGRLQEDAEEQARKLRPGNEEAQRQISRALLTALLEEIRTAGVRHAGTLNSTYVGGELFVEYLVKQRSMGGIRSLLEAMGETKSVDDAFVRVHGQGFDGTRRAWLDWLRLQWGAGAPRRE